MDFRLYTIERKGFFVKHYEILEDGVLKYTVTSPAFSFLRKFVIKDHNGLEIMQILRPFRFMKIIFQLNNFDQQIAEIKKIIKFGGAEMEILSRDGAYLAQGNFWKNDFTIFKDTEEVAKISRSQTIGHRNYGVAIKSDKDELLMLGIAMSIEIMLRVERRRRK